MPITVNIIPAITTICLLDLTGLKGHAFLLVFVCC